MITNMITIGCIAMAVHVISNLIREEVELYLERKELEKMLIEELCKGASFEEVVKKYDLYFEKKYS